VEALLRSEIINQGNYSSVEWDEGYFKFCEFDGFSVEASEVSSDFVSCSFTNLDWYWVLFNLANFIECRFTDCVFRGTTFAGVRFVDCHFTRCGFLKDNLNSDCSFPGTMAYRCVVEGGEGFRAEIVI
jgi:fluoroquinolone resistance protein